jgi:hypothetical protein
MASTAGAVGGTDAAKKAAGGRASDEFEYTCVLGCPLGLDLHARREVDLRADLAALLGAEQVPDGRRLRHGRSLQVQKSASVARRQRVRDDLGCAQVVRAQRLLDYFAPTEGRTGTGWDDETEVVHAGRVADQIERTAHRMCPADVSNAASSPRKSP